MKSKISIVLMVGFVVSLCALTTWAQDEEQKAQLFMFEEVVIKPSMVNEIEASLKGMVAHAAKYNHLYPWYTYSTDDFYHYYVMQVQSFGDVENLNKAFGELVMKAGEPMLAIMNKFLSSIEYYRDSVIRHRPDISFIPEKTEGEQEEANFYVWHIDYVHPGKESEYEAIHKEWVAMNKRLNSPSAYNLYVGEMGIDRPVYIGISSAKNPAEWYKRFGEFLDTAGKEGQERLDRIRKLIRKFESKHVWFRPELSYIPKDK